MSNGNNGKQGNLGKGTQELSVGVPLPVRSSSSNTHQFDDNSELALLCIRKDMCVGPDFLAHLLLRSSGTMRFPVPVEEDSANENEMDGFRSVGRVVQTHSKSVPEERLLDHLKHLDINVNVHVELELRQLKKIYPARNVQLKAENGPRACATGENYAQKEVTELESNLKQMRSRYQEDYRMRKDALRALQENETMRQQRELASMLNSTLTRHMGSGDTKLMKRCLSRIHQELRPDMVVGSFQEAVENATASLQKLKETRERRRRERETAEAEATAALAAAKSAQATRVHTLEVAQRERARAEQARVQEQELKREAEEAATARRAAAVAATTRADAELRARAQKSEAQAQRSARSADAAAANAVASQLPAYILASDDLIGWLQQQQQAKDEFEKDMAPNMKKLRVQMKRQLVQGANNIANEPSSLKTACTKLLEVLKVGNRLSNTLSNPTIRIYAAHEIATRCVANATKATDQEVSAAFATARVVGFLCEQEGGVCGAGQAPLLCDLVTGIMHLKCASVVPRPDFKLKGEDVEGWKKRVGYEMGRSKRQADANWVSLQKSCMLFWVTLLQFNAKVAPPGGAAAAGTTPREPFQLGLLWSLLARTLNQASLEKPPKLAGMAISTILEVGGHELQKAFKSQFTKSLDLIKDTVGPKLRAADRDGVNLDSINNMMRFCEEHGTAPSRPETPGVPFTTVPVLEEARVKAQTDDGGH